MGKNFLFAFQSILSRLRNTFFFSKMFVSAKRETRASEASEMRAQSAKPKGAKRPRSPAGLTGRSAERDCKLVELKNTKNHANLLMINDQTQSILKKYYFYIIKEYAYTPI